MFKYCTLYTIGFWVIIALINLLTYNSGISLINLSILFSTGFGAGLVSGIAHYKMRKINRKYKRLIETVSEPHHRELL